MKKILLLLVFGFLAYGSFGQIIPSTQGRTETVAVGAQTYLLCSSTGLTGGGAFCGCSGGCIGVSCTTSASGNCVRDPQTLTLNIPADVDVTIDIIENGTCGQGLDTADDFFVQGALAGNGTDFPYSNCFFTEGGNAGIMTVGVDSDRPDECITITVTAVANGGIGGDGTAGCATPLPVDLVSFKATFFDRNSVKLDWATASEENNSHFEVEHSLNGRDFTAIGKVHGIGTTSELQNYHFVHDEADFGKNYYRLRQVDFDGAFEYSSVAVVTMRTDAVIEVRPTMVTSSVQVMLEEGLRTDVALQVVDITGRQMKTATIAKGTQQFDLNVTDLNKGAYFIQFNVAGEVITRRFVKM